MFAYKRGDNAVAVRLWRPLAEDGSASAQTLLAFMYLSELGVPEDFATAAEWYLKGAEQGHAAARLMIGVPYANGQGVLKDYVEAYKWISLGSAKGAPGVNVSIDLVAKLMSSDQIAKVQRLTREWVARREELQ